MTPTTDEIPESNETGVDPEPWTRNQHLRDLFKLAPEEILPEPPVVPAS